MEKNPSKFIDGKPTNGNVDEVQTQDSFSALIVENKGVEVVNVEELDKENSSKEDTDASSGGGGLEQIEDLNSLTPGVRDEAGELTGEKYGYEEGIIDFVDLGGGNPMEEGTYK
ncbi:hypothetical protein K7X08_006197 [Anisodus acutangulus]|uniref:Uncharacterized protein n=1 Tax=Anisodus acutangulus TaxID=402998 RepID=A0A9Q1MVM4_9SOLA|nr:hypothetical protein K7X08_006197 [Anisodus acutangulus]